MCRTNNLLRPRSKTERLETFETCRFRTIHGIKNGKSSLGFSGWSLSFSVELGSLVASDSFTSTLEMFCSRIYCGQALLVTVLFDASLFCHLYDLQKKAVNVYFLTYKTDRYRYLKRNYRLVMHSKDSEHM